MTFRSLSLVVGLLCGLAPTVVAEDPVLAKVNGQSILSSTVQGDLFLRQLPEQASPEERERVIDRLIDRELIRQFLARRKVVADPERVELQVQAIRKLIEKRGEQPDELLGKLGLDDKSLQAYLALPIAWNQHVQGIVTEQRILDEWKRSGHRFDGTRVTASQIVRFVDRDAPESDRHAATQLLEQLRDRILKGELPFADAAREHSQSPSGAQGGSLGEFEFHGRVARHIAEAAFALKPGETSPVVRSANSLHLVHLERRTPGDLSPEDVRPQLIELISEQLWRDQVARERQSAKIERIPR